MLTQSPHPPMFAACSKPDTAKDVGKLGLGALNFAFGSDDYLEQKVIEYRKAVEAAAPVGRQKTNHFACTPACLVLKDDKKACEYGFRGARFFMEALQRYYLAGDRPTGVLPIERDFLSPGDLQSAMANRNGPGAPVATIVGDPKSAIDTIERFHDIGVDELILVMQMGTVPDELIRESIKTFAEEVIPHFR